MSGEEVVRRLTEAIDGTRIARVVSATSEPNDKPRETWNGHHMVRTAEHRLLVTIHVDAADRIAPVRPTLVGIASPRCTTCGDSGWSIDDESNRRRCHCGARRL